MTDCKSMVMVDMDSFEFFDIKNSIFTKTEMQDYTDLIADLQIKKEEKLIEKGEFFDSIVKNSKMIIQNLLSQSSGTADYYITFE